MAKKTTEIYLNEKIKELLEKANYFEKRVVKDREDFFMNQIKVQEFKKDNPEGTFKDVAESLKTMQETHYNSFLLEQNLQHILNTVMELNNMAQILDVEIDLSDKEREALDKLSQASTSIFTLDENKEVVLADTEMKEYIEKAAKERLGDDKGLEQMYVSIPAKQD